MKTDSDTGKWQDEMAALRALCAEFDLQEETKWGKPCFTDQGKNILILQGFKEAFAVLFFRGALLDDPDGLLERPGENSHIGRRFMFSDLSHIRAQETNLKGFIRQAIEATRAGLEVEARDSHEPAPQELLDRMEEFPDLKTAFHNLTPGRQRGYILYFSGAKQSATRRSRVRKYEDRILAGKGMQDR